MFVHAWESWARRQKPKKWDPKTPPIAFSTDTAMKKRLKARFKNFVEMRRERLLTGLGIDTKGKIAAYTKDAGGGSQEVSVSLDHLLLNSV
jgi:hypothetical protein